MHTNRWLQNCLRWYWPDWDIACYIKEYFIATLLIEFIFHTRILNLFSLIHDHENALKLIRLFHFSAWFLIMNLLTYTEVPYQISWLLVAWFVASVQRFGELWFTQRNYVCISWMNSNFILQVHCKAHSKLGLLTEEWSGGRMPACSSEVLDSNSV